MKYHELKAYIAPTADGKGLADYYLKSDVDAAIDELKAEINYKDGVGKRWFERCMEARTENIRLKRALWLMRAERASDKARIFYFAATCGVELNIDGFSNKEKGHARMRPARWWRITWLKVERKCRAKAEEYK